MRATVIPDASFCPIKKVGGWAAWASIDGYQRPVKGFGTFKTDLPTSTYAEVYAALNGVWLAARRGATRILVRSDCRAVEYLINGTISATDLRRVWTKALAAKELQDVVLESRWIKGHGSPQRSSAAYVNDWCDRNAKAAMKAARAGRHITEVY